MVAFVIQTFAANGKGCLAACFQSGLVLSVSVVEEDCRSLCWLSTKTQGTEIRNRRKQRTWQWAMV